jgi:peptide/nickel transport system substrate-binding protein
MGHPRCLHRPKLKRRKRKTSSRVSQNRNGDTWFHSNRWNGQGFRCPSRNSNNETRKSAWQKGNQHPQIFKKQSSRISVEFIGSQSLKSKPDTVGPQDLPLVEESDIQHSYQMKSFIRFSAATACLVTLLGAGCGKGGAHKSSVGHELSSPLVVQCEPGQRGGRLTLVTLGAPQTFNPLTAVDNASAAASRLLFASLVSMDAATRELSSDLAESWSVDADQKTWTFKLRPGLRWSDGERLTADDVVFTWNDVMYNPQLNQSTYGVFLIGGRKFAVSKVDESTVRVVLPEPFAPFLEYFGSVFILPRHTFESAVQGRRFAALYNISTQPRLIAGCGPFRVKEVRAGGYVLLERNPEYWAVDKRGQRLPYIDELLLVSGGPGDAQNLFLSRETDVYEQGRPDEYEVFKQAAAGGKFRLEDLGAGLDGDFLFFNQNTGKDVMGRPFVQPAKLKWFRNKKFRQAISCAMDRDGIVREVYGGRAKAVYTFVSPDNQKWHNPGVPRFGYDPARARALLAETGLEDRNGDGTLDDADGTPVEFRICTNTGNSLRERAARSIVEDLKKIGIKVEVQVVEFPVLLEMVNLRFDYECMLIGLGGGGIDPLSQVNVLKSDEPLHQWFPNQQKPSTEWEARVDELMEAQMRAMDFAHRKKLFDEIQAIVAEEQPMISTVAPFQFAVFRPDLGNVRPSLLSPHRVTWNVQELYFKR